MKRFVIVTLCLLPLLTSAARADTVLFSYDGDILPSDPASGLIVGDACDGDCSARIDSGHFVMEWGSQGNDAKFGRIFSDERPPTLWVEWRFRSNQPKPSFSFTCDGYMETDFGGVAEITYMFQDWVVDFSGSDFVSGLAPGVFHTYRFESPDGANYTVAIDGVVFHADFDPDGDFYLLIFGGVADCGGGPDRPDPVRNEWDYIRYGTIGNGEQLVSADPPAGNLTAAEGAQFHSFTITFDQPAYLYANDISVSTTGGVAPTVVATRRPDNAPPEVLEVAISGQLPPGETTTFTFDTGTGPQSVSYHRDQPEVPATPIWGLALMLLASVIVGSIVIRRSALGRSVTPAGVR